MYHYKDYSESELAGDAEDDIVGLFETDDPKIQTIMAQVASAYGRAVLDKNEELKNQLIKRARELKVS